jgi:phosphoenolpyruvate carboxylase
LNRSEIHFPPKHEPLRDDVHALGALIGEILREQGGEQLFELVELDRVAAIRGRAGSSEARVELAACVRDRPPVLARDLVRAFATWFQVVNLAEQVHRIRRRREYFLKDSQRPQPGGVEDAIAALKARGLSQEQVLELIGTLSIQPVFAPHSTEPPHAAAQAAAHRAPAARATRPEPDTERVAQHLEQHPHGAHQRVADRRAAARAAHGGG